MNVIRIIFIILLAQVFAFFIFEFGFTISQNFNPTPYYQAKKILEYDISTKWKHRGNLNINFLGGSFKTNPDGFRDKNKTPKDKIDILLLGPSSAVGWNVNDNQTYSEILTRTSTRKVFNAAQIGFTIEQGINLYKKFFTDIKVNTVILSFGINELDYFSFWNSDNNIYNFTRNYFNSIDFILDSIKSWEGISICTSEIQIKQRVSLKNFELLTDNFIKILKQKGIQVILINTAQNYKTYNSRLQNSEVLNSTKLFKDYKRFFNSGDCQNAHGAFTKAIKYDSLRIENKVSDINLILRKLARNHNLPLVDIDKVISNKVQYFFDHIHFSKEGNKEIANLILQKL